MKVRFMWVAVQGVSSYIVTNKLLTPSRGVAHARGRALVLPVMNTSERKPFLASGDQLFPQLVRACVVFDGICVQCCNFPGSSEHWNDNTMLYPPKCLTNTSLLGLDLRRGSRSPRINLSLSIESIDAFTENVEQAARECTYRCGSDQLDSPRLFGDWALRHENSTWNHNGIQEVESNLPMSCQICDACERCAVIAANVVKQDANRGCCVRFLSTAIPLAL